MPYHLSQAPSQIRPSQVEDQCRRRGSKNSILYVLLLKKQYEKSKQMQVSILLLDPLRFHCFHCKYQTKDRHPAKSVRPSQVKSPPRLQIRLLSIHVRRQESHPPFFRLSYPPFYSLSPIAPTRALLPPFSPFSFVLTIHASCHHISIFGCSSSSFPHCHSPPPSAPSPSFRVLYPLSSHQKSPLHSRYPSVCPYFSFPSLLLRPLDFLFPFLSLSLSPSLLLSWPLMQVPSSPLAQQERFRHQLSPSLAFPSLSWMQAALLQRLLWRGQERRLQLCASGPWLEQGLVTFCWVTSLVSRIWKRPRSF